MATDYESAHTKIDTIRQTLNLIMDKIGELEADIDDDETTDEDLAAIIKYLDHVHDCLAKADEDSTE